MSTGTAHSYFLYSLPSASLLSPRNHGGAGGLRDSVQRTSQVWGPPWVAESPSLPSQPLIRLLLRKRPRVSDALCSEHSPGEWDPRQGAVLPLNVAVRVVRLF